MPSEAWQVPMAITMAPMAQSRKTPSDMGECHDGKHDGKMATRWHGTCPPKGDIVPRRKREEGWTTLYRFFDDSGKLLYVGISARLPERLRAHRRDKPWWTTVSTASYEHFETRAEAESAEKTAILTENPLWNRLGANPRLRCYDCNKGLWSGTLVCDWRSALRVVSFRNGPVMGAVWNLATGEMMSAPEPLVGPGLEAWIESHQDTHEIAVPIPWRLYHDRCGHYGRDGEDYSIEFDGTEDGVVRVRRHLDAKRWVKVTNWDVVVADLLAFVGLSLEGSSDDLSTIGHRMPL